MKQLSTGDKIGIVGVIIAVLAIVASLLIPEIRGVLGLEDEKAQQEQPKQMDTVPVNTAPASRQPSEKPTQTAHQPVTTADEKKISSYRSIVVDSAQRPVAGVRVICLSCETQQTVTGADGSFVLQKHYPEAEGLRQLPVSLSKGTKTLDIQLDFRYPVTITF